MDRAAEGQAAAGGPRRAPSLGRRLALSVALALCLGGGAATAAALAYGRRAAIPDFGPMHDKSAPDRMTPA